MIKAVVFDVDGVILKYNLFSDRYCKRFNLSREVLAPFFRNEFRKSVIGEVDIKKLLKKYIDEWKWNRSIDELMAYGLSEDEGNEEMIQLIKQLNQKGVKTYIGSNQERHRAEHIQLQLGMRKFFAATFFSHAFGVKKPDREFFLRIFKEIKKNIKNLKKDQVLFVDDQEENVISARVLGFKIHHYRDLSRLKKQIAHLTGA